MQLFYTNNIQENHAYLGEDEARHCIQVLRKQVGDTLHFVDGLGTQYEGEIVEAGKKKCVLAIKKKTAFPQKDKVQVQIAIAPTKNIDRLEWFLEKATEIGITEITPILCHRSERKRIRVDRLQKRILAAMKQSLQAFLPQLNELEKLESFLKRIKNDGDNVQRLIAHCEDGNDIHLKEKYQAGKNVIILIGPEGDFSPKEIEMAQEAGFEPINLGVNRLRTETAGIVACHIIALKNT